MAKCLCGSSLPNYGAVRGMNPENEVAAPPSFPRLQRSSIPRLPFQSLSKKPLDFPPHRRLLCNHRRRPTDRWNPGSTAVKTLTLCPPSLGVESKLVRKKLIPSWSHALLWVYSLLTSPAPPPPLSPIFVSSISLVHFQLAYAHSGRRRPPPSRASLPSWFHLPVHPLMSSDAVHLRAGAFAKKGASLHEML